MNGNKLPLEYDDVLDVELKKGIDVVNPYFKQAGFTPNMITTLSFLCGLFACYLYTLRYYTTSALVYGLSYVFDVMDGYFARKYNMGSTFGSYYDSATDLIVVFLFTWLILSNPHLPVASRICIFILGCTVTVGTTYHMSCQEKYTHETQSHHKSKGLSFLDPVPCYDYQDMKFSKYFGTSTMNVVSMMIIAVHPWLIK